MGPAAGAGPAVRRGGPPALPQRQRPSAGAAGSAPGPGDGPAAVSGAGVRPVRSGALRPGGAGQRRGAGDGLRRAGRSGDGRGQYPVQYGILPCAAEGPEPGERGTAGAVGGASRRHGLYGGGGDGPGPAGPGVDAPDAEPSPRQHLRMQHRRGTPGDGGALRPKHPAGPPAGGPGGRAAQRPDRRAGAGGFRRRLRGMEHLGLVPDPGGGGGGLLGAGLWNQGGPPGAAGPSRRDVPPD